MTEPDQIEFTERIRRPILSGGVARAGMVLGAALLFVVGVMSAMGASPSPSTGADPSAGASGAPADPNGTRPNGDHKFGFGPGFGGLGSFGGRGFGIGFGGVTITAINGSNLSLKTDDGWTRTITVTSDTTITRAGTTIAVSDLKVGDEIALPQDRQDDGTYTVTEIRVVLPSVAGQVTAVDGRPSPSSGSTARRRRSMSMPARRTHRRGDGSRRSPTSRSAPSSSRRAPSGPTDRSTPRRPRAASVEASAAAAMARAPASRVTRRRTPRRHPPRRRADAFSRGHSTRRSVRTAASFDSHEPLRRERFHGDRREGPTSRPGGPAMSDPTRDDVHDELSHVLTPTQAPTPTEAPTPRPGVFPQACPAPPWTRWRRPCRLAAGRGPGLGLHGRDRRLTGGGQAAAASGSPPSAANAVPVDTALQASGDLTAVVAAATPSVVTITVDTQAKGRFSPFSVPATGVGSGVILSADGYILTNRHVVAGSTSLSVELEDGTPVPGDASSTRPATTTSP